MNASISGPVEAIPQSTPISSVRDLRMRHSDLLQRQRSTEMKDRVTPGEMLGFLEAAHVLGKILPDRAQRENAQGVMDYWTASLLSVAPSAGEQTRPFSLAAFEEGAQTEVQNAEALARERVSSLVKAASAAYDKAPAECQKGVRSVLRRMVRLKANSLEAYAGPLQAMPNDPDKTALAALVQAGVLTTRPASSTAGDEATTYELADPSILQEWKPAYLIVTERRGFREMARGWDKSGRKTGALLQHGSELENLAGYAGLDELEDAFFKASNVGAIKARQRVMRNSAILVVLGVLVVLMSIFSYNYRQTAMTQERLASAQNELREARDKSIVQIEGTLTKLKEAIHDKDIAFADLTRTTGEKDKALAELTAANKAKDKALIDLTKANGEKDKALADLKELKDTTTANEQKFAGVMRDLQTVANLLAPRTDLPPEVTAIIEPYRSTSREVTPQAATTGQRLADALTNPNERADPQPGIRISVGDDNSSISGSLGVFVKKKNSPETYLIFPRDLFTGAAGTQVYSGGDMKNVIATLIAMPPTTPGLADDLALAKVADGISVSNSLPGLGTITEVETQPKIGMKVLLVGSGSGIKEGVIEGLGKNGLITTTRLSQAGDAGAPVVTAEGNRLVGLLYGRSSDDQSLVVPATLMDRYGLELATPAVTATSTPLQGAVGEILVADIDLNFIPRAQKYVKALLDQGMIMPVPTAQPRQRVPAEKSEVRCYDRKIYEDPDSIAHRAMKLLIAAGIPEKKIRVSLVDDPSAPRNFLQISLTKNALSTAQPQRGTRSSR